MQKDRPLWQNVQSGDASRPTQRPQTRTNAQNSNISNTSQNNNYPQNTGRVRNIKPLTIENTWQAGSIHSEENESFDPESTCYIREMMVDWSTVNIVNRKWSETRRNTINKTHVEENWLETQIEHLKVHWLVDTGSPRSFLSQQAANWLKTKLRHKIQKEATKVGELRCFNNNKIQINNTLNINITSRNTSAINCEVLVVPHNTVNLPGMDVLQKLGTQLSQMKTGGKAINPITTKNQKITHKIFTKLPHLCTRMGQSKKHMAKSKLKQYF